MAALLQDSKSPPKESSVVNTSNKIHDHFFFSYELALETVECSPNSFGRTCLQCNVYGRGYSQSVNRICVYTDAPSTVLILLWSGVVEEVAGMSLEVLVKESSTLGLGRPSTKRVDPGKGGWVCQEIGPI